MRSKLMNLMSDFPHFERTFIRVFPERPHERLYRFSQHISNRNIKTKLKTCVMKIDFKCYKFRHHLKWFSNILYLCLLYLCELIYFNNMQHQIGQSDCRDVSQLLPDGGFQPTKIASMRIKAIFKVLSSLVFNRHHVCNNLCTFKVYSNKIHSVRNFRFCNA